MDSVILLFILVLAASLITGIIRDIKECRHTNKQCKILDVQIEQLKKTIKGIE